MEQPLTYTEHQAEPYRENYWITKPKNWSASATVCNPTRDAQAMFNGQSTDYVERIAWPDKHANAPETSAVCVAKKDAALHPATPTSSTGIQGTNQRDGLIEYSRGDIELQLATLTEYIRNKKLRPMEWICCSCSKEQRYRDNLDPFDRLRCQNPRCGVSDKGFRIYRVHDMCNQCTVFVDQRAPTSRKALKKKRDEVREVLKKIKRVYEDVDRLAEFDEKEAVKMADLIEQRQAREELERERQEDYDFYREELEKQQKDQWVDQDGDDSNNGSHYEEALEQEQEEDVDKEGGQRKSRRRQKKKRGFKGLLGL